MPLELGPYKKFAEYGFWIVVSAFIYVLMQKVMHPGWTIFGF